MTTALAKLTTNLASRLNMGGDDKELISTLKATAFKGDVSDAQMTALMVVANQYGLNPWTKEIYAFPDKKNGIIPVVGVDGWSRIINNHPEFDGMEFSAADEMVSLEGTDVTAPAWMECRIYRKDRSRPTVIREYIDEVYRAPFKGQYGVVNGPWQTHPKRFLRHKALIQCGRVAFGYAGITDPDEAERIVEIDMGRAEVVGDVKATGTAARIADAMPTYTDAQMAENLPKWKKAIVAGKKTAAQMIATVETKYTLTEAQRQEIRDLEIVDAELDTQDAALADLERKSATTGEAPAVTFEAVAEAIAHAETDDELQTAADLIGSVPDAGDREALGKRYKARGNALGL